MNCFPSLKLKKYPWQMFSSPWNLSRSYLRLQWISMISLTINCWACGLLGLEILNKMVKMSKLTFKLSFSLLEQSPAHSHPTLAQVLWHSAYTTINLQLRFRVTAPLFLPPSDSVFLESRDNAYWFWVVVSLPKPSMQCKSNNMNLTERSFFWSAVDVQFYRSWKCTI